MIIGNGLVADFFEEDKFLKNSKDVLIFASGVSNSKETDWKKFELEKRLFSIYTEIYGANVLYVYFSSCALSNKTTQSIPYYKHKNEMENLVRKQNKYIICRIPQITNSSNNPHTIINFFINAILKGQEIKIQKNAKRYFIDCRDVVVFLSHIIQSGKYINFTFDMANSYEYTAEEAFCIIARCFKKNPIYTITEGGFSYKLDLSSLIGKCKEFKLDFGFGEKYLGEKLKNNN